MFTVITNHVEAAIARLIGQYKGKKTIEGTVGGVAVPIQELEYALDGMNNLRTLNGSVGVQLDLLGAIVGIARVGGQSDDDYRTAIKARIQRNVSNGTPEEVIAAFQLLSGADQVILDEFYPAELLIESNAVFSSDAEAQGIIADMEEVAASGVRIDGLVSFDSDNAFSFDGPLPGGGFGDLNDPTVGGKFSNLYVPGGEFAFAGPDSTGKGFGDLHDPLVGGAFVGL